MAPPLVSLTSNPHTRRLNMVSLTLPALTALLIATQVFASREVEIYTDEAGKTVTIAEFPYVALGCSGPKCDKNFTLPASYLTGMPNGKPTPIAGGELPWDYTGPKPLRWDTTALTPPTPSTTATQTATPAPTTVPESATSPPTPTASKENKGHKAVASVMCVVSAALAIIVF